MIFQIACFMIDAKITVLCIFKETTNFLDVTNKRNKYFEINERIFFLLDNHYISAMTTLQCIKLGKGSLQYYEKYL